MDDHEIENGPKNSGGGYRGAITIREALNRSINTVAWQVLQKIGVNNGLDYLGKLHFHKLTYIDNDVDALAIGGFTNGVRVVAVSYTHLETCHLSYQGRNGKIPGTLC